MLVVNVSDQLGNQMFAYASVKTIVQEKGFDFHFIRAQNDRVNDTNKIYGSEIHTIFPQAANELLKELPISVKSTYNEEVSAHADKIYSENAKKVSDNTFMNGHFIPYTYFKNNMEHVRQWFTFPEDIFSSSQKKLQTVQEQYPDKHLVAIHFRTGEDYLRQGFLLRPSYWIQAAEYMLKKYGKDQVIFLPFYDRKPSKGGIVNQFFQQYPCVDIRGSLVQDMCCMTFVKDLIVCNSSFSAMAGILNTSTGKEILRPSVYPASGSFQPTDCFPDEWTVIPAKASLFSWLYYHFMKFKGMLLKLLK